MCVNKHSISDSELLSKMGNKRKRKARALDRAGVEKFQNLGNKNHADFQNAHRSFGEGSLSPVWRLFSRDALGTTSH